MEINLAIIGMVLIVASWLIQILFSLGAKKEMRLCFPGLQALGIIFLVVNTWLASGTLDVIAWLNIASAGGAFVMLSLLFRRHQSKQIPPMVDEVKSE